MTVRVGVVSDGKAEIQALKILLRKVHSDYEIIESASIFAPIYPKATPKQIAEAACSRVNLLHTRSKATKVIVIIDREDLKECPGTISRQIANALDGKVGPDVAVVIKDKKFENWLIASPDNVSENSKRFSKMKNIKNKVSPNLADSIIESENLLKKTAIDKKYKKGSCPSEILQAACPDEMKENSRSFRKFLKEVGHPQ